MSIPTYDYANVRRVVYPDSDGGDGGATFVPVCPHCGRWVKADPTIRIQGERLAAGPTGTCRQCGRVEMPFEGFI